jgi:hypothetical protein
VVVIEERLYADILRGIRGEHIADAQFGDFDGLSQVHGTVIAPWERADAGTARAGSAAVLWV